MEFKLHAPYEPTGDQPQAIEQLVKGFKEGVEPVRHGRTVEGRCR